MSRFIDTILLPIIVAFAVIVSGLTASAERITYSYESSLATSTQTHAAHVEAVELALRAYQTYFTVEFQQVNRGGGQWKIGVYNPPVGVHSREVWAWPTWGIFAIGTDARMIGPGTPFHEILHLLGSDLYHRSGPPGTRLHDSGGADAWLTVADVLWIEANTSWRRRPGWTPARIAADRLEPFFIRDIQLRCPKGVWVNFRPETNGLYRFSRARGRIGVTKDEPDGSISYHSRKRGGYWDKAYYYANDFDGRVRVAVVYITFEAD